VEHVPHSFGLPSLWPSVRECETPEIRNVPWDQIDFEKRVVTVGKSKTAAGEGRTIPMNEALFNALIEHSKWFTSKFGMTKPEWYIFPARVGRPQLATSARMIPRSLSRH
jgi:hypothetical protein